MHLVLIEKLSGNSWRFEAEVGIFRNTAKAVRECQFWDI